MGVMTHRGKFSIDGHDTAYQRLDDGWYYFNDSSSIKVDVKKYSLGKEYHHFVQKVGDKDEEYSLGKEYHYFLEKN
jgi:ubiquitin C-terminal hydrolase